MRRIEAYQLPLEKLLELDDSVRGNVCGHTSGIGLSLRHGRGEPVGGGLHPLLPSSLEAYRGIL